MMDTEDAIKEAEKSLIEWYREEVTRLNREIYRIKHRTPRWKQLIAKLIVRMMRH